MINFDAFARECCKPFSETDSNCATAAVAALGSPPAMTSAVAEWFALPEFERAAVFGEFSARGALARSFAMRHGLRAVDKESGSPSWGVARIGAAHTFAVYDGVRWYARGAKGIRRIHPRYILDAWSIA